MLHAGGASREDVRATWKHVSSSSERQLGAFAFLWLRHFGKPPELLNTKHVSFRNDVVHKGHLPERKDAIDFGNNVLAVILPKLRQLHETLPDSVHEMVFYSMQERRTATDATQNVGCMTIPTIFRMAQSDPDASHSVATHLELVLKRRHSGIPSVA